MPNTAQSNIKSKRMRVSTGESITLPDFEKIFPSFELQYASKDDNLLYYTSTNLDLNSNGILLKVFAGDWSEHPNPRDAEQDSLREKYRDNNHLEPYWTAVYRNNNHNNVSVLLHLREDNIYPFNHIIIYIHYNATTSICPLRSPKDIDLEYQG